MSGAGNTGKNAKTFSAVLRRGTSSPAVRMDNKKLDCAPGVVKGNVREGVDRRTPAGVGVETWESRKQMRLTRRGR